jgi:uncharacterized protein (TIGR03083 family)
MLSYDRYLDAILHSTADLADSAAAADPAGPVPTCPEWSVADLVGHVGRVQRFAATVVERQATEAVPFDAVEDATLPADVAAWGGWLNGGAHRLVTAVREAGPDAPVWAFVGPRTATFWARRMAHETAVHAADARYAAGRNVSMPADLSADGISEGLDLVTLMGGSRPELRGTGETLHFHATDGWLGRDGEWLVRRTPEGVEWEHAHAKADVAVRGNAADLLLLLTRRITPDSPGIQVLGDGALFDHWFAATAF